MNSSKLKFRKKGSKEPVPRRARHNYPLYKLAKDLKLEEISLLITVRKNKIKYEQDYNKIMEYKRDILLLEDMYKIKRAEDVSVLNRWKDENKDILYSTNLGVRVGCMISYLGFTGSLYKDEGTKLSEKLVNKDMETNIDIVAASITMEILDYYGAKFDEDILIDTYDLDKHLLYKIHFSLHNWCKRNYWRK